MEALPMAACSETRDDKQQMEELLRAECVGHIAMCAEGELYLVPLNYAYAEGKVLFHCSLQGKKLDMIRANPQVCFEISRQHGDPVEHGPDGCDAPFESVICWGTARVVDDVVERRGILDVFQARYVKADGSVRPPITEERAQGCGAVEITVTRMTGRRWSMKEQVAWEWTA
jgi:uncharacterized protein